ncbi:hypothetical protein PLCT2_01975 [Planctomycetaceae bacterium]|nr:hypothetical protein PLCT2_01975 [Planctomycetaceae bacterium]
MDRGVKIAIFVASIVSLGLGLIWDQVLNHAREVVAEDKGDGFHSEKLKARIGPKDLQRQEIPADLAPDNVAPKPDVKAETEPKPDAGKPTETPTSDVDEYTVQAGDSWWKIAYTRLKGRGLSTESLQKANPGVELKPGVKLKIPKKT